MQFVPAEAIPALGELPQDLMLVYKTCLEIETLCEEKQGIGLAAAQVGIPWRLFVLKEETGYRYYVDCCYEPIGEEKAFSIERCLSLPNSYKVSRFMKIRFFGKELIAQEKPALISVDMVVEGRKAVVLQHEADHCFGVLISTLGEKIDLY